MQNRFIVFGHGRCGTNWVKDSLKSMLGTQSQTYYELDQWALSDYQFPILHTNLSTVIKQIPEYLKEQSTLLVCLRNPFDTVISLYAAQYTNEWYHYTEKSFDPISINSNEFMIQIVRNIEYTKQNLKDIPYYYNRYAVIDYEKFYQSKNKTDYLSEVLNLSFPQETNSSFVVRKNPRDYKKLIANYNELKDLYKAYVDKKPVSWLTQIS